MKEPTDKELNIAICEWRGWIGAFRGGLEHEPGTQHGWTKHDPKGVEVIWADSLPSHITGIEALGNMHEALKSLSRIQRARYLNAVARETSPSGKAWDVSLDADWNEHNATSRQRAIALLSVVNPEMFR